jgi:hypothetical protein
MLPNVDIVFEGGLFDFHLSWYLSPALSGTDITDDEWLLNLSTQLVMGLMANQRGSLTSFKGYRFVFRIMAEIFLLKLQILVISLIKTCKFAGEMVMSNISPYGAFKFIVRGSWDYLLNNNLFFFY